MKNIKFILIILSATIFSLPLSSQLKQNPEKIKQARIEQAKDSLNSILEQAKRGDTAAQNEVGLWYYIGRHTEKNYEQAFHWWNLAAKNGNVEAIGNLGLCYQTGNGVAADSLLACRYYQTSINKGNEALFNQNVTLAENGDMFSNMLIASCYRNGYGVKRDIEKSIPYYERAADKGSVQAMTNLGILYLRTDRADKAKQWFEKGAQKNNPACIYFIGEMYMEGKGYEQNKAVGADKILKAAQMGFPQAMYYLGNCYMTGEGITKNTEQAIKMYKQAAAKNSANGQWALAQCYREGIGVPINYQEAIIWYARAISPRKTTNTNQRYIKDFTDLVNNNNSESPFVAYLRGVKDYNAKNFEEALKQFKIVEKAGIADGKIMTAQVLLNPEYPKKDVKKAIKLLNEVGSDNARAIYILAQLYESGEGVEMNMSDAVKYMKEAADLEYAPAECELADMYYEGRGVEKDYSKAVELYTKAYQQGLLTENAARRLIQCYEDKLGVDGMDVVKANEIRESVMPADIDILLNIMEPEKDQSSK